MHLINSMTLPAWLGFKATPESQVQPSHCRLLNPHPCTSYPQRRQLLLSKSLCECLQTTHCCVSLDSCWAGYGNVNMLALCFLNKRPCTVSAVKHAAERANPVWSVSKGSELQ